jgi:hypothetical protein
MLTNKQNPSFKKTIAMEKFQLLSLITIVCTVTFSASGISNPGEPDLNQIDKKTSGYITINEFPGGFGLRDISVPYASTLVGFTTVHGYVINNFFTIGGGTGVSFYNGGTLLPLFLDVRYHHNLQKKYTPFFFGNGGFLFEVSNISMGTRLFLNAGPGMSYAINRNVAFNLGSGLLIQKARKRRDTFINFKLGVSYRIK